MKIRATYIALLIASFTVTAGTTYTPQQLNRMINSGQYPSQGKVNKTQSKSMSFSNCKVAVENVMSQLRGSYPVKTIVNTSIIQTKKAWTNDGVITASCSKPDNKMVLTQASYK